MITKANGNARRGDLAANGETDPPPATTIGSIPHLFLVSVIILLTVAFSVLYLDLPHKFWFEDDPMQYAAVKVVANPLQLFLDPAISRNFGAGASAVPMQLLSYWVDVTLFGVSPLAAYLHSILSLAITTTLMYLLFARLTGERLGSALMSLVWMFIPGTIAVHYFLAARHYMEGLGWSLLACLLLLKHCDSTTSRGRTLPILPIAVVGCALAAVLSKEVYVTTLPCFIFCYCAAKKRYALAFSQPAILISYACYRFWLIGGVGHYPVSLLGAAGYLRYLATIPYTLTVGSGGYGITWALAIGTAWLTVKRWHEARWPVAMIALLVAAALGASYPTASAVLGSFPVPGTWYRATFIINSLLFLAMGYLLLKFSPRRVHLPCLVVVLLLLIPGANKTRFFWNYRMWEAGNEAVFYLQNPDKLLLSQDRAPWYIDGIAKLYDVQMPHHIKVATLESASARSLALQFPTIWKVEDGVAVADDGLYRQLTLQNSGGGAAQ